MNANAAVAALSALAQETRLAIFRTLVTQGADGLPAGALAQQLAVAPPTLTFHLNQLAAAGLVSARREGRQIFYALQVDAMRTLLDFLLADCCQGRPELCAPLPSTCCRPAAAGARKPLRTP